MNPELPKNSIEAQEKQPQIPIEKILQIIEVISDEDNRKLLIERIKISLLDLFKENANPSSKDFLNSLNLAFLDLYNFLEIENKKNLLEGLKSQILETIIGASEAMIAGPPPAGPETVAVEVKKPAAGVEAEVPPKPAAAQPVERPKAEEPEIKKSKAEIYREVTKLGNELEKLQKRFLAVGPKWDNYQTKLVNLNNRIENETLTKDLINEWQKLKNEITQDIELEREKGKQPEYQEQKKKEQIDLRLKKLDELKPPVELMLSKMTSNKEIEEINNELNKLTAEINKLPSAEKLKEIDERIDQLTINFNEFIKNLRVTDVPQEVKKFLAEKLKYFDIDPQEIFEKLTNQDLRDLKILLAGEGWERKIVNFFKDKIKVIITDQPESQLLTEEKIEKTAIEINRIIQETIENQARQELMKFDLKKAGRIGWNIGKNAAIFGGSAVLASSLGLTGIGLAASATITGQLIRYALEKRKIKKVEAQEKYLADLKNAKTNLREKLIADEHFKEIISAIISTEIRRQTSVEASQNLRTYEKFKEDEVKEITDKDLKGIEHEFFLSALTMIKAEYPNFPQAQQEQMAYLMASNLSQHEQGENDAKKKVEKLKKDNKKVFEWVNKFNALRVGKTDKKPANITQSWWDKYKYETAALAIGTGVGIAIRLDPMARVIGGALAGAGAGLMAETYFGRKKQEKIFEEIESLIQEAEAVIRDIEFPANELPQLRIDVTLVQSRLNLGLLDTNPMLKSRAENFIHQVRLVEFANQKVLNQLLLQQQDNRKNLEEKMEADVSEIGKATKFRRWAFFAGGAIFGAAGAFIFTDIREKLTGHYDLDDVFAKHHGEFNTNEEFYGFVNEQNLQNPSGDQLIATLEKVQGGDKNADLIKDLIEYYNLKEHPGEIWHFQADDGGEVVVKVNNNGTIESPVGNKISLEDFRKKLHPQPTEELKTGGTAGEEIKTGGPGVTKGIEEGLKETEKVQTFSNVIKSSELGQGRHDSIWYSTNQMIVANNKELGFTGKPEELDHWAEVMTNKLVNDLDTRTTGGIKDLVHDGDKVSLDLVDGKWQLKFEATSGIEAGYLPPKIAGEELKELEVSETPKTDLETLINEKERLVNQLQDDIKRLRDLQAHGVITEEELQNQILEAEMSYHQPIGSLELAIEDAQTKLTPETTLEETISPTREQIQEQLREFEEFKAGVKSPPRIFDQDRVMPGTTPTEAVEVAGSYQQAEKFLTKVDPAHQGQYELIIGKPDSPNTEMIGFINQHQELSLRDVDFVDHGVDLVKLKLNTHLNPETVFQIQKDGFHIKTMVKSEGIFKIDHTIIFQKGDEPAIFIDKEGHYGFRVGSKLVEHGQINLTKFNQNYLKTLEVIATDRIKQENY